MAGATIYGPDAGYTSGSTISQAQPTVWVRYSTNSDWEWVPFLRPERLDLNAFPQYSRAVLRYDFGTIKRETSSAYSYYSPINLIGWLVKIEQPSVGSYGGSTTLFYGRITDEVGHDAGNDIEGGTQELIAFDLSSDLDKVVIEGSSTDTGWVDRDITFNKASSTGPTVIGNMSESSITTFGSGWELYVFSNDEYTWTNAHIVTYLLAYFTQNERISWDWEAYGNALQTLESVEEVHDFRGLTLREALIRLLPRNRGVLSYVTMYGDSAVLVATPTTTESVAVGDYSVGGGGAPTIEIAMDRITDADLRWSNTDEYDAIDVIGGPIYSMFTLIPRIDEGGGSFRGELEIGWTEQDQADYNAGTGIVEDDAEDHDAARRADKFSTVYQKFQVYKDWDWYIDDANAAPGIDPSDYSISSDISPAIWNGQRAFERWIPLTEYTSSTTPEYRRPFAILQDSAGVCYLSERFEVDGTRVPVSMRLDSGDLAVHLSASINHEIAGDDFDGVSLYPVAADWRYLHVSACAATDMTLWVRGVMSDGDRIRTLLVRDADAWWITPGTVVDVENGAMVTYEDSDYYTGSNIIKDDTDRLWRICVAAMTWYGRPRRTIEIRKQYIAENILGHVVERVYDSWHDVEINTPVTSILYDFNSRTSMIRTGYDELAITEIA